MERGEIPMNEITADAASYLRDAVIFSKYEDCEDDYKCCLREYNKLINELKKQDKE